MWVSMGQRHRCPEYRIEVHVEQTPASNWLSKYVHIRHYCQPRYIPCTELYVLNRPESHLPAIVDLPTPPLADETATTLRTLGMRCLVGSPLCMRGSWGGAPLRGSPWGVLCQLLFGVRSSIYSALLGCEAHRTCLLTSGFSCRRHLRVENGRVVMFSFHLN